MPSREGGCTGAPVRGCAGARGRGYDVVAVALSRPFIVCAGLLLLAQLATAEVVRVEVARRDDFGSHERIIGRVHFEVDPALPANRGIVDIDAAPRNARGRVEFSSDVLFFRPKAAEQARGTVFLEVVNRGRDQSLAILSGARQGDLSPASWSLGDRFLLEQGFTVAFLGWQFDVRPDEGLTFDAPVAPVEGLVRGSSVGIEGGRFNAFRLPYCASPDGAAEAVLTRRLRIDGAATVIPRGTWRFSDNGCVARVDERMSAGLYEVVYRASGSPVAGLGLAAIRDFASYLRHGADAAPLRETPAGLQRVIGYGYSQSARLLREFVRDGFNADERGRQVFDGLMIAAAGAGGGSFNHRFAMPGMAGNSVLSMLRPVDVPPFVDEGLLTRARAAGVVPKIVYTFSSTEYWARAGSLTHTTDDGLADAPLAPTSRLYLIAGTPHATGPLPPTNAGGQYRHFVNFAGQSWVGRALLVDLDAWVRGQAEPPPSTYPTIAARALVSRDAVRFPAVPTLPFPSHMPQVWRMDYGPRFATERVITQEPPALGERYRVLVPQVDADGNDVSGVRIPEIAVPLGTYTGWNITLPQLADLGYLAGLVGAFEPFAATRADRERQQDPRLSIAERYRDRADYMRRVRQACERLVAQRFMLAGDVTAAVEQAARVWDAVVDGRR